MLKQGDKAPGCALLDRDGCQFSLSAAGTKTLIYFYP